MANNDSNDEDGKNTGDMGVSANIDQSKVVKYISLYYLHPFDHPGLIFVTNPLSESGDHYFTWSGSFMNAFHSKNKVEFVDRMLKKPDIASLDFQPWIQCNVVVLSWLLNALSKELQSSTAHIETATKIWEDLGDLSKG
ncbi:hypothetical protein Patl1_34931 [Pistacia atlantica]|uniref:Uncharacterized protein n=1 Tax=Pistacia atlantica TaxID=434234 RepID=A0ACC0ZU92_9ROSI|nr:hypothetical protein Patl1_34931 [Pistacia atlantica]